MVKVITSEVMVSDTITHATVYSNRKLSEGKALAEVKSVLRAHGFMVSDLVFDRSSDCSAMVSAHIQ